MALPEGQYDLIRYYTLSPSPIYPCSGNAAAMPTGSASPLSYACSATWSGAGGRYVGADPLISGSLARYKAMPPFGTSVGAEIRQDVNTSRNYTPILVSPRLAPVVSSAGVGSMAGARVPVHCQTGLSGGVLRPLPKLCKSEPEGSSWQCIFRGHTDHLESSHS
jgi:hypothetical protein